MYEEINVLKNGNLFFVISLNDKFGISNKFWFPRRNWHSVAGILLKMSRNGAILAPLGSARFAASVDRKTSL